MDVDAAGSPGWCYLGSLKNFQHAWSHNLKISVKSDTSNTPQNNVGKISSLYVAFGSEVVPAVDFRGRAVTRQPLLGGKLSFAMGLIVLVVAVYLDLQKSPK